MALDKKRAVELSLGLLSAEVSQLIDEMFYHRIDPEAAWKKLERTMAECRETIAHAKLSKTVESSPAEFSNQS